MSFSVLGRGEVLAMLARNTVLGKLAAEAGARAVSEDVAGTARGLVEVDTGETRDSITVSDEGVTAAGAALYLEFGTYKMAAEPFMRPAADEADDAPAIAAALQVFGGI